MSNVHQQVLLSPAELAYLHSSLSQRPDPIRPDGRSPTQFRPLVAETGILPSTNGSARICFADGTEAIVGVKAEVEKTKPRLGPGSTLLLEKDIRKSGTGAKETTEEDGELKEGQDRRSSPDWVELTVDIPGIRDDDSGTAFLGNMLSEALLADQGFTKKLWINSRFHWKLYLDILLISPRLSYPLPLLSLTTHLALLSTRLPRLISEGDEDPMFDDDWAASTFLYPRTPGTRSAFAPTRPPVTLLIMCVGDNIIFDPTYEELAVADAVLAVSVGEEPVTISQSRPSSGIPPEPGAAAGSAGDGGRTLRLLSIRTIDPPSRLTPPGVPNALNPATNGEVAGLAQTKHAEARTAETARVEGVWKASRGGAKRTMLAAMIFKALEKGGVVDEVLDGLESVELC